MNSNNNNNFDDDTVATGASSFVHIDSSNVPSDGHPLIATFQAHRNTIGLDAVDVSTGEKCKSDYICVIIKSQDTQEEDERAPIDIVITLDVSGSMSGEKLELCKKTLETVVRVLQSQDRFGLITYASDARVDLPPQRLTPEYKEKCLQTIRQLTTRGCTNISAGLGLAVQEMKGVESPNPVRSIFLLTDGLANEGISDAAGLVQLAKNCLSLAPVEHDANGNLPLETNRGGFMGWTFATQTTQATTEPLDRSATQFTSKSQIPITLHTFGYGADHNDSLLQEMADTTEGGIYYFVEDDKSVSTAFGDAIGGVVSVVAQNAVVKLQVPPAAAALGVKIEKVHHDQVIPREDGSYTVTVGDFYAEETRDVVLTVQLAVPSDGAMNSPIPHVTAKLCYTDTLQRRPVETTPVTVSISRPAGDELSAENDHVVAQWLRVYSVEQMKQAEAHAAKSDFGAARAALTMVGTVYHQQSSSVRAHAESANVFNSSLAMMDDMTTNQAQYQTIGSKRTRQTLQSHRMQRSNAMAERKGTAPAAGASLQSGVSAYETKSKSRWRNKFA